MQAAVSQLSAEGRRWHDDLAESHKLIQGLVQNLGQGWDKSGREAFEVVGRVETALHKLTEQPDGAKEAIAEVPKMARLLEEQKDAFGAFARQLSSLDTGKLTQEDAAALAIAAAESALRGSRADVESFVRAEIKDLRIQIQAELPEHITSLRRECAAQLGAVRNQGRTDAQNCWGHIESLRAELLNLNNRVREQETTIRVLETRTSALEPKAQQDEVGGSPRSRPQADDGHDTLATRLAISRLQAELQELRSSIVKKGCDESTKEFSSIRSDMASFSSEMKRFSRELQGLQNYHSSPDTGDFEQRLQTLEDQQSQIQKCSVDSESESKVVAEQPSFLIQLFERRMKVLENLTENATTLATETRNSLCPLLRATRVLADRVGLGNAGSGPRPRHEDVSDETPKLLAEALERDISNSWRRLTKTGSIPTGACSLFEALSQRLTAANGPSQRQVTFVSSPRGAPNLLGPPPPVVPDQALVNVPPHSSYRKPEPSSYTRPETQRELANVPLTDDELSMRPWNPVPLSRNHLRLPDPDGTPSPYLNMMG